MKLKNVPQSIAMLSVLALSACGGSDDSTGTSDQASPSPSPTPIASPAASPSPMASPKPSAMPSALPSAMPSTAPSPTVSSAPATSSAPIVIAQTRMGGIFTAKGSVDVLMSDVLGNKTTEAHNLNRVTLYTSREDSIDTSNCNDTRCLVFWYPMLANENDVAEAPYSIINRKDGMKQWGLRGMPVYFSRLDSLTSDEILFDPREHMVAVVQPVRFNSADINTSSGVYLTAAGRIHLSQQMNAQDTTRFKQEPANMLDRSLYTFDLDSQGVSSCNDTCLKNWPALLAGDNDQATQPYSLIERKLGSNGPMAKQWALNGKPLYFYIGDSSAADINGHALANWRLARPAATQTISINNTARIVAAGKVLQAVTDGPDEPIHAVAKDKFTLYTFDGDTAGKSSTCKQTCLDNWPALMAYKGAEAEAPFSLIARESGELQWAINGMPLYFYRDDMQASDANGDGLNGRWHLAKP